MVHRTRAIADLVLEATSLKSAVAAFFDIPTRRWIAEFPARDNPMAQTRESRYEYNGLSTAVVNGRVSIQPFGPSLIFQAPNFLRGLTSLTTAGFGVACPISRFL